MDPIKKLLLETGDLMTLRRHLRKILHDMRGLRKILDQELFAHIATMCQAYLINETLDPQGLHFRLTSGMHSNGYVSCPLIMCYPEFNEFLARQLVLNMPPGTTVDSDCVVGSTYAAITFSYEVARILGLRHIYTEHDPATGQRQALKRFDVLKGERILNVEELMTTAGTTGDVREGIREKSQPVEPMFLPQTLVCVHRSNVYEFEGGPIIYAVHLDILSWMPGECPLCAQNSPLVTDVKRFMASYKAA